MPSFPASSTCVKPRSLRRRARRSPRTVSFFFSETDLAFRAIGARIVRARSGRCWLCTLTSMLFYYIWSTGKSRLFTMRLALTALLPWSDDGPDPRRRNRAIKAGDFAGAAGGGEGDPAEEARREPAWPVSLPRRPRAVTGDHAEQESLALLGCMPEGGDGDRLGDASGGGAFSARGGAAARRSSFFRSFSGEA